MKKIILLLLSVIALRDAWSQTSFITSGKIEFERRVNVHRLFYSGTLDAFSEKIKSATPQFKSSYFDLVFNEEKSIYQPGREIAGPVQPNFFSIPAQDNVIYNDLQKQSSAANKSAFETKFLLLDSLKTYQWRIEAETRTIAGFECRKAVTRICDSVVVVAFYTDQIIPASGPESFSGLPGMILGLAVPRLYTTWFATKLELINASDEKKIVPPSKGKKATITEVNTTVLTAIKTWGNEYRDRSLWFINL